MSFKTIPYHDQLHLSIALKGRFQMQVKQCNYIVEHLNNQISSNGQKGIQTGEKNQG